MTSNADPLGARPDAWPEPDVLLADAGPADAVAAVWYRLGYRPAESLVLVALHEPAGRLGLTLRCDLPPGLDARGRRALIRGMYLPVRASGATRVLAMQFSAGLFTGPRPGSRPPLRVAEIHAEVGRLGGVVTDVIGIGPESYRSLSCRDESCCPRGGFPIAEVESSRAAATFTAAGRVLVPGQADLVLDVTPDPAAGPAPEPPPAELDVAARLEQWGRWAEAFGAGAVDDGAAAGLGPGLRDPWLRDAVLLTGLGGDPAAVRAGLQSSEHGWEAFLDTGCGRAFDEVLGLDPGAEGRAALLERSRVVLATVARRAVPGARAGALAVLAMHAWYQGDTTRARLLVDLAVADQPGQTLARLVADLLASGTAPRWLPDPWVGRAGGRSPGRV